MHLDFWSSGENGCFLKLLISEIMGRPPPKANIDVFFLMIVLIQPFRRHISQGIK